MTTNSQLSTTEPKEETKKLNKQLEQEQIHRNRDHMESYQQGKGGGNGGKGTENKQHKWQVENIQGEGKNIIGNVEAKELICMTHEHELSGGRCWTEWGYWVEEDKEEKKEWDNCNSIINKI